MINNSAAGQTLRLLFIGNSHTYYNDMPNYVRIIAEKAGYTCFVTMLTHGGWLLGQHTKEPEVRFNILYGAYDYVVLQERSHPFAPEDEYRASVLQLNSLIREAGGKTVLYETWSRKDEPEKQEEMNRINRSIAEETGALIAPVGENWWQYKKSNPDTELYSDDGGHASPSGSEFAANLIAETILCDFALTVK